jgi:hypothetical protein
MMFFKLNIVSSDTWFRSLKKQLHALIWRHDILRNNTWQKDIQHIKEVNEVIVLLIVILPGANMTNVVATRSLSFKRRCPI